MNFPFFIAKRYFFARKKTSFISLISMISMLGVGVGTMALVVVLSVFNGLEDFQRGLYKSFDADLKVSAKKGKYFSCPPALLKKISKVHGIGSITQVIEENVLLRYRNAQMVVNLKGVDESFLKQERLQKTMIDGHAILQDSGIAYSIVGSGIAVKLGIDIDAFFTPLEVWYPRNKQTKTLDFYATDAFNKMNLVPAGVFAIEQQYDDNYIYAPLSFAQNLFELENQRTALEIKVANEEEVATIQDALKDVLGNEFVVQNQDEQHASLLRAIKIEKLFVFLTLTFIIGIASFNIFFSLSMLAIEKKEDVKTLYAMGADAKIIQKIFLLEGAIVAFTGAIVGLILGFTICWLQLTYGFISMGIVGALIDAYPIKMEFSDFFFTAVVVVIITLLASYFPAKRAASVEIV
ncbi:MULTISPECIES: ABC transporter permease [Arcicella]|uniref:ABC transporter permease n=1 Tax=Arcicella aquatica TaxID=217141 RepID=A0ABU5QQL1_9BACT|nr:MULTISPECIES: ABC transporter permease [Arcicella]MDR6563494.1 lipoprotein-releasing system permease protein [Arcicella sp. BE51]MDR6813394.1 lipoprotein-releasing system permease protein [Arcicella sp. BE140]MDR6824707.1 lipoprotein-releasing system permease protein [Arcicella sp. BE139]MEA5259109.1 ABC transporter permease [Arcicella aquatica]